MYLSVANSQEFGPSVSKMTAYKTSIASYLSMSGNIMPNMWNLIEFMKYLDGLENLLSRATTVNMRTAIFKGDENGNNPSETLSMTSILSLKVINFSDAYSCLQSVLVYM